MNKAEILKHVDHTNLKATATLGDIEKLCAEAAACKCATVCVPPAYVHTAKKLLPPRVKVCTVIGFPLGYASTTTKTVETVDAVACGADEIDMVINLGWVKDGKYDRILAEIKEVRKHCQKQILKVIIETCYLTEAEKIKLCDTVSQSGADYIKTSTGFGSGGATLADIKLLRQYSAPELKIKAAGGISDFETAAALIEAGADRLGSSRLAAK